MTAPTNDLAIQRLRLLKDFDDNVVDQLIGTVGAYTAQERATLAGAAEEIDAQPAHADVDKAWLSALIEDDRRFLTGVETLVYELAIAALCKKIDITVKQALLAAYPDAEGLPGKFDKLCKYLHKHGIEIESLPHYQAVNELRCLNHDIRHGGGVGKKLAAFAGWDKGDDVRHLDAAYTRLAPLCANFIKALIEALIERLSRGDALPQEAD